MACLRPHSQSGRIKAVTSISDAWTSPPTQGPVLKVTGHYLAQRKLPLSQGSVPPITWSVESMDPGPSQSMPAPFLIWPLQVPVSVPGQQKETRDRGNRQGSGAGCRGILPTLQSGQAATSVLPVNSNSDPESSNFSGGKSLGLFLSCSSWKGTNWHRSHVHTLSYTTYDTKRGANTRQASGALWVTHGGQVS